MSEFLKKSLVRVNTVTDLPQGLTLPHLSEKFPFILVKAGRIEGVPAPRDQGEAKGDPRVSGAVFR